jgi:3-phenylpropionate/trans-cinnamate dioxygenase ferredoxin component
MKYIYSHQNPANCDFVEIAPVEELPPGERLIVQVDEFDILIFNIAGEFFAIGNVCSHDGNPLDDGELSGYEIICPRHGARFDVRSGEVISLPAVIEIPAYLVRVVDGNIEIGLPKR